MEKTRSANLERNRGLFLQLGFFLALALIWLVLEWTASPKQPRNKTTVGIEMDIEKIVFYSDSADTGTNENKHQHGSSTVGAPMPTISPYLQQAEHMPKFPGGVGALKKYTENKLCNYKQAKQKGIEGKVLVSFLVDTTGWVQRARVVRSVHPNLDKVAIRIVNEMPRWIPAFHHGKKTAWVVLPITFVKQKE